VPSTAPDPSSSADQPNGAKLLALALEFLLPKKPHQVLLERRPTLERSWQRAHSAASANPLIQRQPCFTGSLFKPPTQCTALHPTTLRHRRLLISRQVTSWSPGSKCRTSSLAVPVRRFTVLSRRALRIEIRGTSNGVEWWDDVNAAFLVPFPTLR